MVVFLQCEVGARTSAVDDVRGAWSSDAPDPTGCCAAPTNLHVRPVHSDRRQVCSLREARAESCCRACRAAVRRDW